ncbi:MAG: methylmalonyl-CoA mutase family protein [Nitrososphaeraceae archaeon]
MSKEKWRALVDKDLAGASFDKLLHRTPEGITIEPLYTERPTGSQSSPSIYVQGTNAQTPAIGLCIRVEGDRSVAVEELNGGATVLWIDVGNDGALDAAAVAHADLVVDIAKSTPSEAIEWLAQRAVDERIWIGIDPITATARGLVPVDTLVAQLAQLPALVTNACERLPNTRPLCVSTMTLHGAGADAADELALCLSAGVAYLRALVAAELPITEAARTLWLQLPVSGDTFGEMCKLRAVRVLWHKVLAAAGAPDEPPPPIHAVASARTQAQRDPWVNMLRVTTEMFAAIIGGAQIVTPRPFDDQLAVASALGRRVARNTVLVLRDESHLGRVVDAADGSFYIETRTDALAREAWKRFTAIEKDGGITALVGSGTLRARLDAAWAKRAALLAKRKEPVLGVSEFAHIGEKLPADPASVRPGPVAPALVEHRDAETFEALRARIEVSPRDVMLLALGPSAEHRGRTGYSAGLFGTVGIRTREATAPERADVAVICGSDQRYATEAAEAARALKSAGVNKVMLAGNPGPLEDELRAAGVDAFVFVGCDVLATLEELLS